ncbi:hypothetical protein GCM10007928_48890 [Sulfitobacter porphyrae]|nr:hypothetical protein GCM10007928_48890 [Sulfitobacter porphyrae]
MYIDALWPKESYLYVSPKSMARMCCVSDRPILRNCRPPTPWRENSHTAASHGRVRRKDSYLGRELRRGHLLWL